MMVILTILSEFYFVTTLIGGLTVAFLLWTWFGTGYYINNETLKIQSGPFKKTITIHRIASISQEKSVWSAPALAAERLGIQYDLYETVLISPKNENEFIEELLKRNKDIEVKSELFTTTKDREEY